jgi:formylglycine-generating enzyme required for sulfatase activity
MKKPIYFILTGIVVLLAGLFASCENPFYIAILPEKSHTITFDPNGGTGGPAPVKVRYGEALPVVTAQPVRTSYFFAGYYDAQTGGTEYYAADLAPAKEYWDKHSDTTLYAKWTTTAVHDIVFHSNDGHHQTATQEIPENSTRALRANTFARHTYMFAGWSTTATWPVEYTDGTSYTTGAGTSTVNLYAVWTIDMASISAGTFTMGSPASEPNRSSNETQHSVTLTKGFYMGKYQVTQEQWQAVMGNNPSYFTSVGSYGGVPGDLPVEMVNWYHAIVFCNKLSVMEGLTPAYEVSGISDWGSLAYSAIPTINKETWDAATIVSGSDGYRLPTEAQWEYACRAGTTTAFNWGTNKITSDQANFDATSSLYNGSPSGIYRARTTVVGSFAPNAWGLYDMHGNVYEWCWDWYNANYGSATASDPAVDPLGAASGTSRVIRGGVWVDYGQNLRSAYRGSVSPDSRFNYFGFRLLRP